MTPQEFKEKMEQLSKLDTERRHIAMDDCMCELLTELGYGEDSSMVEPQTIIMVKDHGRKQALEMIDLYHELTDEPQIVRSNLEPFRVDEPQTNKEIVLDSSFAELSDEQFAEAMKLIEPRVK